MGETPINIGRVHFQKIKCISKNAESLVNTGKVHFMDKNAKIKGGVVSSAYSIGSPLFLQNQNFIFLSNIFLLLKTKIMSKKKNNKCVKVVIKGNKDKKISISQTWIGFDIIPEEKEREYLPELQTGINAIAHYLEKAKFDISTLYISVTKNF